MKAALALAVFLLLLSGAVRAQAPGGALPTVQRIGREDLEGVIRQNAGKTVLVNLWATWCKPCRDEMPSLIRLRKELKDRMVLVLVSADDSDLVESKVRLMLASFRVDFHSFQISQREAGEFMQKMQPDYNGALALPTSFIFNKQGKLMATLTGGQTYKKIRSALSGAAAK